MPLLTISDLVCSFDTSRGVVRAVRGVTLELNPGETLGLVGESGCGKTTLAKSVVGLVRPTAGSIRLNGIELVGASRAARKEIARDVQFIFQDPYSSLNPRRTAEKLIREPLDVHGVGNATERMDRVDWLMQRVGLRPDWKRRYPHEFSGGQRQRIGIARALALNPKLIVCDEPVSALDVSVQAQVINLLADLQREFSIAYLFISHDLALVEIVADRVAVMSAGEIVESAPSAEIWATPKHPYTRELIAATPVVKLSETKAYSIQA
jgi:ABC-type glutathione transport system ATPase component